MRAHAERGNDQVTISRKPNDRVQSSPANGGVRGLKCSRPTAFAGKRAPTKQFIQPATPRPVSRTGFSREAFDLLPLICL